MCEVCRRGGGLVWSFFASIKLPSAQLKNLAMVDPFSKKDVLFQSSIEMHLSILLF